MDDMHAKLYGLKKTAEHQMVSPSQNCDFSFNIRLVQASLESTDTTRKQHTRLNFIHYVETGEQKIQAENHESRLANLRKELINLKETDWQYEPIEKYIGQS